MLEVVGSDLNWFSIWPNNEKLTYLIYCLLFPLQPNCWLSRCLINQLNLWMITSTTIKTNPIISPLVGCRLLYQVYKINGHVRTWLSFFNPEPFISHLHNSRFNLMWAVHDFLLINEAIIYWLFSNKKKIGCFIFC